MIQRPLTMRVMPGMWAFPGGAVEEQDRSLASLTRVTDAAGANPERVSYLIAAIRELFEETGILLAESGSGTDPRTDWAAWRRKICAEQATFGSFLSTCDLTITSARVGHLQHWITPPTRPIRFDARFLVAKSKRKAEVDFLTTEVTDVRWMVPAEALAAGKAGELPIPRPTLAALGGIAGFSSADHLLSAQLPLLAAFADAEWNQPPGNQHLQTG